MWVAGVDGCRAGWVVALRHVGSGELRLRPLAGIAGLDALAETPQRIAIDMPAGLQDSPTRGGRDCERAARRILKGKTSSVFSAPCRGVLDAPTYADALRLSRATGPHAIGLSQQAFHLLPRLRDLDCWITPQRQRRCIEAHPELAFARLNGGSPVLSPKRKPAGRAERLLLLREDGLEIDDDLVARRPGGYGIDDALDAIVLTCTAERHLRGEAICLPADPPRDGRGLAMAIWY